MSNLRRLLILEDDPLYVMLIKERIFMEWPCCELIHAPGKDEYVAALEEGGFDVILSDYSLPQFCGATALEMAKAKCPEVPFLFVSGALSDEVIVESLKAGAVDYILKDRSARLVAAIRRALELAEANGQRVQHEALVNSVDGIVWQAEQSCMRFVFVSQQAEHILGYSVKSWLDNPDFWQKHIHPEDREMAVRFCTSLTPDQNHSEFEYRMIAADGRIVWLREMMSVCRKKSQPPHLQGIMVDVTAQKLAEEKIKEVQSKLEETNRDLVSRNQEIQNFYHTLAHELKTPLTSAREFVSMVLEGLAGPLNKTQSEYLGLAKESCDQLKLYINDLLDTTRLETGKLALKVQPADLGELIKRTVAKMEAKAADRNVSLTFESQPGLPSVPVDEYRITQITSNLLDNAFKFTPSGGQITVRVGEAFGHPNFLQVSIRDTGCGISKKDQENIFSRLFQIKTGEMTSEQGIGLGLYLCQELVWLHGGGIWVESEIGKGSIFTFVLPKSQSATQPEVLVIDDDAGVLEMVRAALAEEYNVRTALDGIEGMKEMRQKLPDVLILDLSMPNMDGIETLKTVRETWEMVPIIVHTAYTNGQLMKQAMEHSPFTLLAKPSPMLRLRQTVRRVLRSADTETWTPNQWEMQNETVQPDCEIIPLTETKLCEAS